MSLPLQHENCAIPAGFSLSAARNQEQARIPSRRLTAGYRQIPTAAWRAVDKVAITLSFVFSLRLTTHGRIPLQVESVLKADVSVAAWLGLLLFQLYWEALASALGLYHERWLVEGGYTSRRALVCLLGSIPMCLLPVQHGTQSLGLSGALLFGAFTTLVISGIQLSGQALCSLTASRRLRHVVIVGSGPRALDAYCFLTSSQGGPYVVLGFIDNQVQPALARIGVPYLGALSQLELVLERQVVDEVHIALPIRSCYSEIQRVITVCERAGAECKYPLDTFEHRSVRTLGRWVEQPAVSARPLPHDDRLLLKRIFDVLTAAVLLFLLSPLFLVIALAIKLTSRGPVFFGQERYGQNRRLFRMYKFRSMRPDAEAVLRRNPELYAQYCQGNFKLPERQDPRVTALGRFLRKASLDELPQLWNVLRGEMAIVGPRPIVPAELAHYGPEVCLLLALKPGLTSIWVLKGRSAVGYPTRAELELSYVRNWSLRRDTWIFLKTLPLVLTGRGAY